MISSSGRRVELVEEGSLSFMFVDLREDGSWDELESALPEGAVDDVIGREV